MLSKHGATVIGTAISGDELFRSLYSNSCRCADLQQIIAKGLDCDDHAIELVEEDRTLAENHMIADVGLVVAKQMVVDDPRWTKLKADTDEADVYCRCCGSYCRAVAVCGKVGSCDANRTIEPTVMTHKSQAARMRNISSTPSLSSSPPVRMHNSSRTPYCTPSLPSSLSSSLPSSTSSSATSSSENVFPPAARTQEATARWTSVTPGFWSKQFAGASSQTRLTSLEGHGNKANAKHMARTSSSKTEHMARRKRGIDMAI